MKDRFKFRYFNKNNSIEEISLTNCYYTNLDYSKLMQCTGLKDKNGKLIYEGDILFEYCKNEVYPKGKYWIVKWNKNQANFYIEMINPSKFENRSEWHLARHDLDYEIIGNNCENLELLTKDGK